MKGPRKVYVAESLSTPPLHLLGRTAEGQASHGCCAYETEPIRQKQIRENETGLELQSETDFLGQILFRIRIRELEEALGIIFKFIPKILSYFFNILFFCLIIKICRIPAF